MSDKQYIDQTFRRAVYLERLKKSLANDFGVAIKKLDKIIDKLDVDTLTPKQLEKALNQIVLEFEKVLGWWSDDYKQNLIAIFKDSYEYELQSLSNAYDLTDLTLPANLSDLAIASITAPMMLHGNEGVLIDELLSKFTKDESGRIKQAIRAGFFDGKTNQQIVQLVRGTRKNKFTDGILQTTTRHANAIVRTGVQQIANDARREFSRLNSDIVAYEQIFATLDGRTSVLCRSLDHKIFKVGEGKRPPFHVNCRSTFLLILKDDIRPDKRASKDGITDNVSYYEWLKSQPKAFQDDALGKTRAKLFRDGGLSADDFAKLNLNNNFEPLTLDEMRLKNPTVFEKAQI